MKKMKKRMTTREDMYMFSRVLTIFLVLLVVLIVITNLVVVKNVFTGISEDDVKYNIEREIVTYEVTGIQNQEIVDGIEYTVSFEDVGNKAPAFESKMSALPTGMAIGKQYSADWVCVTAFYGRQVVMKNLTSMEYTGTTVTDGDIENAQKLVCETLIKNCEGVTTNGGFVFIGVSCLVGIIIAIFGTGCIEKKIANAKPTYWQEMMNEYRTLENTVVDDETGNVQYRTEGEQLFHNLGKFMTMRKREQAETHQSGVKNPFEVEETKQPVRKHGNPFSKDMSDTFTEINTARDMGVCRQRSNSNDAIHEVTGDGIYINGEKLFAPPKVGAHESSVTIDKDNISGASLRRGRTDNPFAKPTKNPFDK